MKAFSFQLDAERFNFSPADFDAAPSDEKENYIERRPSVSYWQDAWRRLRANVVSMVALGVIVALFLFAFAGPYFVPYAYDQQIRKSENLFPMQYSEKELLAIQSGEKVFPHIFGTDIHGRDIFVRLMYGTRISMSIGFTASILVLIIGSIYGSISGFFGGTADNIMMRIAEIISSVPEVLIVLLMAITIKPALTDFQNKNLTNWAGQFVVALGTCIIAIFLAFAFLYWVPLARIIRGQILQIKQQEFVLAARALGASNGRLIRKHLLPNCVGAMVSATCLEIPTAIFLESFLSFLGSGVSAPMTSLGSMASDALSGMYTYTYRLLIPAIFLSVMILSFNLFGDGLRDALDPRLKK
jgi:oligopeptide transport system permease protein